MIGQIRFADSTLATLDDEGVWQCENETVAKNLNRNYDPQGMGGLSAVLPFGLHAIEMAAADHDGEILSKPELEPLPPGVLS